MQISTSPNYKMNLNVPISDWQWNPSSGVSSWLASSSGLWLDLAGVALLSNLLFPLVRCSYTLFTAWEKLKVHAHTSFPRSASLTLSLRQILGGPADSGSSSKHSPIFYREPSRYFRLSLKNDQCIKGHNHNFQYHLSWQQASSTHRGQLGMTWSIGTSFKILNGY